jgi:transposase
MPRFKEMPMRPDQLMLFGQSVEDALPEKCDVRIFNEMMDYLDYSNYEAKCSHMGCPPYPPKIMVKVLGYAYSKGIFSSRNIEEALKVDVRFIWLAGGLKPDHNTIARFRKDSGDDLTDLFKDSVKLCMRAGLVYLNSVSIDGTKIIACASKKRIYNEERIESELKSVEKILKHAEEIDAAEDKLYGNSNGKEIPADLLDANLRKKKLQELAKNLNNISSKNVVSTDSDSRVMKTRNNGFCPAYNLQASVDGANQVILAIELTKSEADTGFLPPMVEMTESNTGFKPDVSLADSGYCDESSLSWTEESNHNVLMPPLENPHEAKRTDLFASKCFAYDEKRDVLICPAGKELVCNKQYKQSTGTYKQYTGKSCIQCSFRKECAGKKSRRIRVSVVEHIRKQMRENLSSSEGKELYSLRKETVEPVFGQMKRNRGFTRLLLDGYKGALAEVTLMCLIHNIYKCMSNAQAREYLALLRHEIAQAVSFLPSTVIYNCYISAILSLLGRRSSYRVCGDLEF